jgi:hypothetical protein
MKHAGTFSQNHLDLGIGTCRHGAPTSNIDIARVKSRPTSRADHNGLTVSNGQRRLSVMLETGVVAAICGFSTIAIFDAIAVGSGPLAMCNPDSHPAGRYAP